MPNRVTTGASLLLLSLTLGTAGCASSPSAFGMVNGRVTASGGPFNPSTGKQALNSQPQVGQAVLAKSGGNTVAHTTTSTSGAFSLKLSPGTYQISSTCGSVVTVVVKASEVVQTDISCSIP